MSTTSAAPTSTPSHGAPYSTGDVGRIAADFTRDGYARLGNLLSAEDVGRLRGIIDHMFEDPASREQDRIYGEWIAVRMFEVDRFCRDLLVREPIISLMESLLGPECHAVASNVVRNPPGQAIDSFHVDDLLWFPLPEAIPRFDTRIAFPNFLINVHFALTDTPTDAYGPTQVVPGSHYSGRNPNDPRNPSFEGRGPVSIHSKAGDVYLQHPQVWHRGAPNSSDRTRYLFGIAYGRRFISQRFFPFLNYRMPDHVLEGADDRLLRVLGKHPKGAYG